MQVTELMFKAYVNARRSATVHQFSIGDEDVVRYTDGDKIVAASIAGQRFYIAKKRTIPRLSETNKVVLDCIGAMTRLAGENPSREDIAGELGLAQSCVSDNVKVLKEKQYLTFSEKKIRSIVLRPILCPLCRRSHRWPYHHQCIGGYYV